MTRSNELSLLCKLLWRIYFILHILRRGLPPLTSGSCLVQVGMIMPQPIPCPSRCLVSRSSRSTWPSSSSSYSDTFRPPLECPLSPELIALHDTLLQPEASDTLFNVPGLAKHLVDSSDKCFANLNHCHVSIDMMSREYSPSREPTPPAREPSRLVPQLEANYDPAIFAILEYLNK